MTETVIAGMDLAQPGSDKTVVMLARNEGKELRLARLMKVLEPYMVDEHGFYVDLTTKSEPVPMMPEETEEWIPNNRKGRRRQAAMQRRRS